MNWYPQLPTWMRDQRAPRPPFQDILAGARAGGGFNPGGAFSGGIPSAQRWNRLAPTERQGYVGHLQDELGVDPGDVMWQMDKLRPRTFGYGQTPRWMGAF